MSTEVFMPALGMNQDTGKLIEWLIEEGQSVTKGEPLMVVETDKATTELEAPATGSLVNVSAKIGEDVPVGKVIALIVAPGETYATSTSSRSLEGPTATADTFLPITPVAILPIDKPISPVAARLAKAFDIDLGQVNSIGKRIQKEDVLAYLEREQSTTSVAGRFPLSSPKARRLGYEKNINLENLKGSGPNGAVLAVDVMNATDAVNSSPSVTATLIKTPAVTPSRMWKVMAQRLTESWQTIPHFYLEAEVNAASLVTWRAKLLEGSGEKVTFTDLIVKLTAIALCQHPRVNASWIDGTIQINPDINIGLAVAVEDGLLVPVIHHADRLGIRAIASRRKYLVSNAQENRLSLTDSSGGTFTISNLGMYKSVDNFNAIINPPEAAILALGRIADKIVTSNNQPIVQPRMQMTLSCDHRVIDGAGGAEFLNTLVELVEDPLAALD